jgi:glucose-6-phosphate isomerase
VRFTYDLAARVTFDRRSNAMTASFFRQETQTALEARIGEGGISRLALEAALVRTGKACERLRKEGKDGTLPLLALAGETHDLPGITQEAQRLREGASDLVILGTGGSSLGGQTLCQLAGYAVPGVGAFLSPRLHFFDNLDPLTLETALSALPLATTRFLVISKSGGTGETLMQAMALIQVFEQAGLRGALKTQVLAVSEPLRPNGKNALRALLEPEGVRFLEHETGIGGRYSVLTNVGLLPAALMGLDLFALRLGAKDALDTLALEREKNPALLGAALHVAAMQEGKGLAVLMPYSDRLERLTRWWVQLWAESLGKKGHGSQPVAALGPVDQHSQLQLYLAGPNDRLFTLLTTGCAGTGPRIDSALALRAGEADLGGKSVGDLVAAQGRATADTLVRNHRPVRSLHVETLNARSLGALLMHFMLETILAGYALDIDPFDQPAVEEGKILARRYLAQ